MANQKKRLDVLLVERGLADSRQRAQAVIMSGQVYVREQKVDKAGAQIEADAPIEVRGQTLAYVSRGGLKLEKALKTFTGIDLRGARAIDAGASTGGFTDCMLQNGAEKVYAVDVGYGQLAWSLRSDPRVVCMERTNVRYLTPEQIPEPLDFGTVDVSFSASSHRACPNTAEKFGAVGCTGSPVSTQKRPTPWKRSGLRSAGV